MTQRRKRWLAAVAGTVVVVVGLLTGLEWDRRRHLAAQGNDLLDAPGKPLTAGELTEKYRDPAEFARLCAAVRQQCIALRERFLHARHTRHSTVTEYDRGGATRSVTALVEHVWFDGDAERKEEVERRQLVGKPSGKDAESWRSGQTGEKGIAPFSQEAVEGTYDYALDGVEEIDGRPLVRIRFAPHGSAEGKMRGQGWVDPKTAEPVRFHGAAARPPRFVDRFEMRVDYGPAENGQVQIRHVVIDAAGGFAFISRHFRVETELTDYRDGAPAHGR
jgi:hypothetical protein